MQVAGILDEVGHYKEAYTFASLAAETFEKVYDKNTDMIYTAKWQKLSLAYRLREPDVEIQATELYKMIFERDLERERDNEEGEYDEIKDQVIEGFDANLLALSDDAMDSIRMMVIVTIIMEITRNLTDE